VLFRARDWFERTIFLVQIARLRSCKRECDPLDRTRGWIVAGAELSSRLSVDLSNIERKIMRSQSAIAARLGPRPLDRGSPAAIIASFATEISRRSCHIDRYDRAEEAADIHASTGKRGMVYPRRMAGWPVRTHPTFPIGGGSPTLDRRELREMAPRAGLHSVRNQQQTLLC
jgi:hypothetical protein